MNLTNKIILSNDSLAEESIVGLEKTNVQLTMTAKALSLLTALLRLTAESILTRMRSLQKREVRFGENLRVCFTMQSTRLATPWGWVTLR